MIRNPLSLLLLALALTTGFAAAAHADDASCTPVSDAVVKETHTPYRETSTVDGKPLVQKIYTTTAVYLQQNGRWMKVPMTPQQLIDAMHASGVSFSDCRSLRTEAVDGQAATVYAAHEQMTTPAMNIEMQIWIANSTGLTLRTECDEPKGNSTMHISTHMAYDHVQPPPGVK